MGVAIVRVDKDGTLIKRAKPIPVIGNDVWTTLNKCLRNAKSNQWFKVINANEE